MYAVMKLLPESRQNISLTPKTFPTPFCRQSPLSSSWQPLICFLLFCLFQNVSKKEPCSITVFGVWLWLKILRSTQIVACIDNWFLFVAEQQSIVTHTPQFIYSPIHQLVDFWVVSSLGLLQIQLLEHLHLDLCIDISFQFLWINI